MNLVETPYWSQPVSMAELIAETLNWATRNPAMADPRLDRIESELPRGSGINYGTTIDRDAETPTQLFRLEATWHSMDSLGCYQGLFDFTIEVIATFAGPAVSLSWANGKGPEEDYPMEQVACEDCACDGSPCETCDGTGLVDDDNAEWYGVSDPSDYLIDVYSEAMRAPVRRIDFDSPPVFAGEKVE